jgi:hypothetical protein
MTTTGELLSIIEKLGLLDAGEATSYLDEGRQENMLQERENDEKGYVDAPFPASKSYYEQETKTA